MDLFHKIIDLVDKNSSVIPEGDYLELCDTIKKLRDKVKPPSFLIDQTEPMVLGSFDPELDEYVRSLHAEWSSTDTVVPTGQE
jgi:hypothetical protein